MPQYDEYNREERALCAHLFRLLHEGLSSYPKESYLKCIIDKIDNTNFRNAWNCISNPEDELRNARIYCEVALIRDAREYGKISTHDIESWADDFTQRGRKYTWSYKALMAAKPDLVIAFPKLLLVFEAKLTSSFEEEQLKRLDDVIKVWKQPKRDEYSPPLWTDFGVENEAVCYPMRLGNKNVKEKPDLSWQDIFTVMNEKGFPKNDRTWIAFDAAITLLKRQELKNVRA